MNPYYPILFAVLNALCWGMYGPALANARSPTGAWSNFKPYVFIGVAYLVWAVGGGMIGMIVKKDSFSFVGDQLPTMTWGFIAGSLGAFGALCLTLAIIASRGNTVLVMPIVFGGAVSVAALFSVYQLNYFGKASPQLWLGIAMVVGGVVLVARNTPHPKPAKPGAPAHAAAEDPTSAPAAMPVTDAS